MRKFGVSAVIVAALLLPACAGDDASTAEVITGRQATGSEQTGSGEPSATPDESETPEGGSGEADLTAALLTAADLPEGVVLKPFDTTLMSSATTTDMSAMLDDITFEPAECQSSSANPFGRDGVEAAGVTANVGAEVFAHGVYSGAQESDIDAMADYVDQCSDVTITGNSAGQAVEMQMTTAIVDEPPVDVDDAVAMQITFAWSGTPPQSMEAVYLRDGDYGLFVTSSAGSTIFDFDALTVAALDRLREAQD